MSFGMEAFETFLFLCQTERNYFEKKKIHFQMRKEMIGFIQQFVFASNRYDVGLHKTI